MFYEQNKDAVLRETTTIRVLLDPDILFWDETIFLRQGFDEIFNWTQTV